MMMENSRPRPLGTMIVHGYESIPIDAEIQLAQRLGAQVLEILPLWKLLPDPIEIKNRASDAGLAIHSAHGCWGGQSIRAPYVDLSSPDQLRQAESIEDLKRCSDWLREAGGTHLIVHPGGLSAPLEFNVRRSALERSLRELAEHVQGTGTTICVENMPPGVHPGSRMFDLKALVMDLDHPSIALALDTGHAQISADLPGETHAAARLLQSTHVHDNDGKHDAHLVPGQGSVDWQAWAQALDVIQYQGPIVLECIRELRNRPELIDDRLIALLKQLTGESS